MNIGFASPVSLQFLSHLVVGGETLPKGYQFAPAADWVKELIGRGHHVTVYTTATDIETVRTFLGDGLTIRIARGRAKGAGRDFFAVERNQLKQMMVEDQCQLIHAHWTYQFALAALASGIPTLVTIHDLPWKVLYYFKDAHRAARLLMAYQVALKGRHFSAVSEETASHFRTYFKPRAKIHVIPNGLPDSVFELGGRSREDNKHGIVFASVLQGWSRRKNADAAIKAFRIIHQDEPSSRLLMFGVDYEPGGPAHRWAIERNLAEGITFVGALPYDKLLQRVGWEVDVIVHPSLDEAFSMAALEAVALRKPVIAGSSTPGMREILDFGRSGVLVDVRNPDLIAKAMAKLAKDADYRNEMGKRGFERASTLYRLNVVMSQYEEMYKTILKS
jgi:glycosyltransferase involved in cell wall biosynthesis